MKPTNDLRSARDRAARGSRFEVATFLLDAATGRTLSAEESNELRERAYRVVTRQRPSRKRGGA